MSTPDFDGETYERDRDHARLAMQLQRVFEAMADGEWHTLEELAEAADAPTHSASARLRDLRKAKFGGFVVGRRYKGNGVWEYQLGISDAPR